MKAGRSLGIWDKNMVKNCVDDPASLNGRNKYVPGMDDPI